MITRNDLTERTIWVLEACDFDLKPTLRIFFFFFENKESDKMKYVLN